MNSSKVLKTKVDEKTGMELWQWMVSCEDAIHDLSNKIEDIYEILQCIQHQYNYNNKREGKILDVI